MWTGYRLFGFISWCISASHSSDSSTCRAAAYNAVSTSCFKNYKMPGFSLHNSRVPSIQECTRQCTENDFCHGVNFNEVNSTCTLLDVSSDNCYDLDEEHGIVHLRKAWTSEKCARSLGSSIRGISTCSSPDTCSSGGWEKVYAVTSTSTVTYGSLEELKRLLQTKTPAVRLLTGSESHTYVIETTYYVFNPSTGPVIFHTPPEQLGNHRLLSIYSTQGSMTKYNVTGNSNSPLNVQVAVYIQNVCGGGENSAPLYKSDSIGDSNYMRAWTYAQRKASTFLIESRQKDDLYEIFRTSSTVYEPRKKQFAATTKTFWQLRMDPDKLPYYIYSPYLYWSTYMLHSTLNKNEYMVRNVLNDAKATKSITEMPTWYADNCRKKVYEVRGTEVHPEFNFENLQNEIINNSARVFITVEGFRNKSPYETITFEPDLITCKLDDFVCEALSVGNPQISNGLLNAEKPDGIFISSVTQNDYVYEVGKNGSKFDYFEVQRTKIKQQSSWFWKLAWYKSSRPYSLVYHYDKQKDKITGDLAAAILSVADFILVIRDHSSNDVQIWKVTNAYIVKSVGFFQLHTQYVYRPLVSDSECPDSMNSSWKLVFQGMKTSSQFLLLYTFDTLRKQQCETGKRLNNHSIKVFAG